jgi:ROK family
VSPAHRSPGTSAALLERLVLTTFGGPGGLTRPQVAELTGLSRPVVAGVVASLVERGELVEVRLPAAAGVRGRPPACYQRAALLAPVLLIRLSKDGSTSASLVSADDAADGPVRCAPWWGSWADWSQSVAGALDRLCGKARLPLRAAVVATSFPVADGYGAPPLYEIPEAVLSITGKRMPPRVPWLDLDPRERLARLFGCTPLLVNHARLAALGEARYGAARGYPSVVHVSLVNGIGAGFVLGGRLITGARGFAGELAHVQITTDGYPCICGNRGCLWTEPLVLPRLEIANGYVRMPTPKHEGDSPLPKWRSVPLPEYLPKLGTLVGQALAPLITAYDPDCVVVDAGLGCWSEYFTSAVISELQRRCPPPVTERLCVVAGNLDDAERWGALALADAHASARVPSRPLPSLFMP